MTMKAERDYLLRRHYGTVGGRRGSRPKRILETDYLPVGILTNLPVGVAGSCLVWRWTLNNDGYGVLAVGGQQKLAHRAAYEATRGPLDSGAQVLHLCHRPYCVQPAHLYLGTTVENVQDREANLGKLERYIPRSVPSGGLAELMAIFTIDGREHREYVPDRFQEVSNAAMFTWPDPEVKQLTLEPPQPVECPGHRFTIPAGDAKVCRICGVFDSGHWMGFRSPSKRGKPSPTFPVDDPREEVP